MPSCNDRYQLHYKLQMVRHFFTMHISNQSFKLINNHYESVNFLPKDVRQELEKKKVTRVWDNNMIKWVLQILLMKNRSK